MTKEEASKRYQIPMKILDAYESWGLCGTIKRVMGAWQYDDQDLERLSTIMALHDMGFTADEVESYMRLLLSDTDTAREELHRLAREDFAIIYITEQLAKDLPGEIAKYKDAVTPAVILIPGKSGSLGLGASALQSAIERAVGADIT